MNKTLIVEYRLTKELWKLFYEAHYAADRSLRSRYIWGVVCIVIACGGLGGVYDSPSVAGLLMVTGFYGVLTKPIFLAKSLRAAEKHPFYGAELVVMISADEIMVRSGTTGYSQPWSNFIGYRKVAPGYIFYLSRSAFFFLPTASMSDDDRAFLDQLLEIQDIKRFKSLVE